MVRKTVSYIELIFLVSIFVSSFIDKQTNTWTEFAYINNYCCSNISLLTQNMKQFEQQNTIEKCEDEEFNLLRAHAPLNSTTRDSFFIQSNWIRDISYNGLGNGNITFKFEGWNDYEISEIKSIIKEAYPVIVKVYSAPAFNITVTVEKDECSQNQYDKYDRKIILQSLNRNSLIHEMVHAFHGDLLIRDPRFQSSEYIGYFPSVWEEGFAKAVEAIVTKELYNDTSLLQECCVYYEDWNKPQLSQIGLWLSPIDQLTLKRYSVSAGAWLKVYFENNLFFRNFNELWYRPNHQCASIDDFIELFESVAPTVEGMSFCEWLRKQYLIHSPLEYYWSESDSLVFTGYQLYATLEHIDKGEIALRFEYFYRETRTTPEYAMMGNLTVSFYNADEKLISKYYISPLTSGSRYVFKIPEESGRIMITLEIGNSTTYASETLYTYLPPRDEDTSGLFGIVIGRNTGTIELSFNNQTRKVDVVNGGFHCDISDWQGKIKVRFIDSNGEFYERYISKPYGNYFMIINTLPDLIIRSQDLVINPEPGIDLGENYLYVKIHNEGSVDANGIKVNLFIQGKTYSDTIDVISPFQTKCLVFSYTYNANGIDDQIIKVIIDPDNVIDEVRKTNNIAFIEGDKFPLYKLFKIWEHTKAIFGKIITCDIDDDGSPEVLVGSPNGLFCFNVNGIPKWFNEIKTRYGYANEADFDRIIIDDIDLNNDKEIVVADLNGTVYLLRNSDGSVIWKHECGVYIRTVAVGDIYGDNQKEIVLGCLNHLEFIDSKGHVIWISEEREDWDDLEVEDLDGDGQKEVIAYLHGYPCTLFAFKGKGSLFWKKEASDTLSFGGNGRLAVSRNSVEKVIFLQTSCTRNVIAILPNGSILWVTHVSAFGNNIALSDFNQDGWEDVVIGGNDDFDHGVYILDGFSGHILLQKRGFRDPIIYVSAEDINIDGRCDLIILTTGAIFGYSFDNKKLMIQKSLFAPSGTLGFIRTDQLQEILVSGYNGLSVFKIGSVQKYSTTIFSFHVEILTNSILTNFSFNEKTKSLIFNVTGLNGTASYCNVTVPKELLEGSLLSVKVNGTEWPFELAQNSTHRFIYFTFIHTDTYKVALTVKAKIKSSMILNVSEPLVAIGSQVRVTGFLTPPEAGAKITLTLIKPDSTTMVETVTTGGDGTFTHAFTVDEAGSWTIRATREGNATHEAAENTVSLMVVKNQASVSCSVSKQRITLGETIIVSGAINPPIPDEAVSLLLTRPNGETFSVTVETLVDGSFSHSFKPEEKGEWRVEARWSGNLNYGSAESPPASFTVEEPFPIAYVMLGVVIIMIGLAGWLFAKHKRKPNR